MEIVTINLKLIKMSDSSERSGRKYAKISIKRRNQLIQFVMQKGKGITQTAKRLNIKLSTAKHIVKTYAEKGYLYNKKMNQNQTKHSSCSKQISKQEIRSREQLNKPQQKELIKVQVKSECLTQTLRPIIQLFPNVGAENHQLNYPLAHFACIPLFYFYSPNQTSF